jgi:hypothetical protein
VGGQARKKKKRVTTCLSLLPQPQLVEHVSDQLLLVDQLLDVRAVGAPQGKGVDLYVEKNECKR